MLTDTIKISGKTSDELSRYGNLKTGSPLSLCTTFRTGGGADLLIEPFSEECIGRLLPILKSEQIPVTVIGGGSNLLVSDSGLRGAVLRVSGLDGSFAVDGDTVYAGAAMSKERFISCAIDAGFGGVEFMAGIPGTVGGGIYMNAGTYMGCFVDILKRITGINSDGSVFEADTVQKISGYRRMGLPENTVVTGAYFALPQISDRDAARKSIDDIVADRWNKHPMEFPSAGSVFKNPEGHSSWKLINDSGLKGRCIGGAMVSEKHTNFIINTGNATSTDIYNLISEVRETVYKKTGIMLETEIKILGEF